MFTKIISVIASAIIGFGMWLNPTPNINLSAAIPIVPANFQDSLATGMGTSDTSFTLVTGKDANGTSLSGYYCFTIDANSANSEFVCGTATGTSVTSVTRGVNPTDPNATSSVLVLTHRRGSGVTITNYPSLGILSRILNGVDTIPNALKYTYNPNFTPLASTTIASKGYVDNTAFVGAPDSAQGIKGVVEGATQAQCAAGTITGITSAPLTCPSQYFNATPQATTTVPVTGTGGKLSNGFIDQTANYSWTGNDTHGGNLSFPSAIPTVTGTPTTTTQVANKAYVDATGSMWTKVQTLSWSADNTDKTFTTFATSTQFMLIVNGTTTQNINLQLNGITAGNYAVSSYAMDGTHIYTTGTSSLPLLTNFVDSGVNAVCYLSGQQNTVAGSVPNLKTITCNNSSQGNPSSNNTAMGYNLFRGRLASDNNALFSIKVIVNGFASTMQATLYKLVNQ